MNCRQMRRLLADEGAGSAIEAAALQTHLRGCAACRRLRDDLAMTEADLRALAWQLPVGEADIVDRAIARVLAERQAESHRRPLPLTAAWRLSFAGVTLAVLLTIASGQISHHQVGRSPQRPTSLIARRGFQPPIGLVPPGTLPHSEGGGRRQPKRGLRHAGDHPRSSPRAVPATGSDHARGSQSPVSVVVPAPSPGDRSGSWGKQPGIQVAAADPRSTRGQDHPVALPQLADASGGQIAAALDRYERERRQQPRSVLDNVPELRQRVTFSELKIPLGELVQRVSQAVGIPLTAAPEVADEPVAVVVNDYPARDLLIQIADLLDYQWHVQAFRRSGVRVVLVLVLVLALVVCQSRTPERPNA